MNLTLSLAFLAPDLVKAAIDGTLPHGILADLPAGWQRATITLQDEMIIAVQSGEFQAASACR